jgi:integrase
LRASAPEGKIVGAVSRPRRAAYGSQMTQSKRAKANTPECYLWLRPESRHIWFRLSVPTRYRGVAGRSIIQCSLGTSDRREASVLAARKRADLHAEWSAAAGETATPHRGSLRPPQRQPLERDLEVAATEAAFLNVLPKFEALCRSKGPLDAGGYKAQLENLSAQRLRLISSRDTGALQLWERVADRCIQESDWHLPKGSEGYQAFVSMIADAGIDALRVGIAKREGIEGEPTSKVVQAGLKAQAEAAAPGESIIELFERYAAQRLAEGRKRKDTINQDRKVVEQFAAFVGAGRSVGSIRPPEVRNWRDTVAALPPKYRSAKVYCGLSMREAAAKAKAVGAKGVSPTTINKYLSTVSPFLAWCRTNSYADQNPCDGLFYDVAKGKNPRPPFSSEELRRIFASPLFNGFERDGREHKPGTTRADDWRHWIPLVCLFTGARIGEIAQLRLDDVREEAGIPYLLIRDDQATGQRTKSGYSRPCPIHSQLRGLGFLSFVARQRERCRRDGNEQLFPELEPNEREQMGACPSRFWRKYLTKIGVKKGADGKGAHSFRHTMADRLRLAGFLDDEIEVALGHNQKTVTSGYGLVRQGTVERIHRMIESVPFDIIKTAP